MNELEKIPNKKHQVNKTDHLGRCALHYASLQTDGGSAVTVLLSLGADPNTLDDSLNSPLHLACLNGNALGVYSLLRANADPDARDLLERSCFYVTAQKASGNNITEEQRDNFIQVLEALAEGGANVELRDVNEMTVLQDTVLHCEEKHPDFLLSLLRPPICMDPTSVCGSLNRTCLHLLCDVERADKTESALFMKPLLDYGAR